MTRELNDTERKEMISDLENLLSDARSEKLIGFAYSAVFQPNGSQYNASFGNCLSDIVLGVTILQQRLANKAISLLNKGQNISAAHEPAARKCGMPLSSHDEKELAKRRACLENKMDIW